MSSAGATGPSASLLRAHIGPGRCAALSLSASRLAPHAAIRLHSPHSSARLFCGGRLLAAASLNKECPNSPPVVRTFGRRGDSLVLFAALALAAIPLAAFVVLRHETFKLSSVLAPFINLFDLSVSLLQTAGLL